jgi:hypothetical protein
MPATGRLQRHAGIHHRQRRTADRRHRRRTVRLGDLGDHAQHVRERFDARLDGLNTALGEAAVADFAALRRAEAAGFTDRERREVVMEQERILRLAFRRIDDLRVARGAERDDDQRLGLAAREQRRTVRARQHADAHRDRADVVELTPVDAHLGLQDAVAQRVVFEFDEFLRHVRGLPALLLGFCLERSHHVGLDRGDRVAALQLVAHLERFFELAADRALEHGDHRLVARRRLPVPRRLGRLRWRARQSRGSPSAFRGDRT